MQKNTIWAVSIHMIGCTISQGSIVANVVEEVGGPVTSRAILSLLQAPGGVQALRSKRKYQIASVGILRPKIKVHAIDMQNVSRNLSESTTVWFPLLQYLQPRATAHNGNKICGMYSQSSISGDLPTKSPDLSPHLPKKRHWLKYKSFRLNVSTRALRSTAALSTSLSETARWKY